MKKRIKALDEFTNESLEETTIQIGYITSTGALWLEKNIIVNNKDFKKKINDFIKENEKQKNKLIDKWKKDGEDEIFSLDVEFVSGSKGVWKKVFSYVNDLYENKTMKKSELRQIIRRELNELFVGTRDWKTYRKNEWDYKLLVKLFKEKFGINLKSKEWVGIYYDDLYSLFMEYAETGHQGEKIFKRVVKIIIDNGHEILNNKHKDISHLYESFNNREQTAIKQAIEKCFNEKGNRGVRDYDILNHYLGKLPFEIDAADIEIGGWKANSFNRQIKNAVIKVDGKEIGYLTN